MGKVVRLNAVSRVPTPVEHLALRSLLKYMSMILGIPYKSISEDENMIKNYANNKSIKGERLAHLYHEYSHSSAKELVKHVQELRNDEYGRLLVKQVLGESWLKNNGVDVADGSKPPTLNNALMDWLDVKENEAARLERRYRGLWRVLRASSAPSRHQPRIPPAELKDINYSLLNIRPRILGSGGLCEFRWYYRGRYSEKGEISIFRGFVIPNFDRLEFFGRLGNSHRPLVLMSWRFTTDMEEIEHSEVVNGISLSLNSDSSPVAAHVRAFFIHNSDNAEGEAFDELVEAERKRIGVLPKEALRNEIPPDDYQRTVDYLGQHEPMVGFHPGN